MTKEIDIARDFSRFPAGRFRDDGPYSGELFREAHLLPALRNADLVEVHMDGSEGYGSSFLEEAFGGLVRCGYFDATELRQKLKIVSADPSLVEEAWEYIDTAVRQDHH